MSWTTRPARGTTVMKSLPARRFCVRVQPLPPLALPQQVLSYLPTARKPGEPAVVVPDFRGFKCGVRPPTQILCIAHAFFAPPARAVILDLMYFGMGSLGLSKLTSKEAHMIEQSAASQFGSTA